MKNKTVLIILSVILAGCSLLPASGDLPFPGPRLLDLGPAPELANQVWINVDQPLRLADLRGQVVLIEIWTYG